MNGIRTLAALAAAGLVGLSAEVSSAALAQQQGGSGHSGTLSSNRTIRKQQLIADPTTNGELDPGAAPVRGSTSVTYNPGVVTLSGLLFGPGYSGDGVVEVNTGEGTTLQTIPGFLDSPQGTETGYVQVFFDRRGDSTTDPTPSAVGPLGVTGPVLNPPGQINPPAGYGIVDEDGPPGWDTHAFEFTYRPNVPDQALATYMIYTDPGSRPSGNTQDFWEGVDENGRTYTLGPGDIEKATVTGNLIPLPPAVWCGLSTMGAMGLLALKRRIARRR